MTALAAERMGMVERWKHQLLTLKSGTKAWKGAELCIAAGFVFPATGTSGGRVIGRAMETVDATAGALPINVDFQREFEGTWLENSGTAAVASTDVGSVCFHEDDQTVGMTPAGDVAGFIWAVSTTQGVLVEKIPTRDGTGALGTATAFASNDSVIPNNPLPGSVLDVPVTAGASTVTLPAAAKEGTELRFTADGTKNGHTVQYRDATGPTNLTTALTASKRHLCVAVFRGGKWFANAYVSP